MHRENAMAMAAAVSIEKFELRLNYSAYSECSADERLGHVHELRIALRECRAADRMMTSFIHVFNSVK